MPIDLMSSKNACSFKFLKSRNSIILVFAFKMEIFVLCKLNNGH